MYVVVIIVKNVFFFLLQMKQRSRFLSVDDVFESPTLSHSNGGAASCRPQVYGALTNKSNDLGVPHVNKAVCRSENSSNGSPRAANRKSSGGATPSPPEQFRSNTVRRVKAGNQTSV